MVSQSDPDGVRTLYGHNAKGEVVDVALEINANGAIEGGGKDRIIRTLNDVGIPPVTDKKSGKTLVQFPFLGLRTAAQRA